MTVCAAACSRSSVPSVTSGRSRQDGWQQRHRSSPHRADRVTQQVWRLYARENYQSPLDANRSAFLVSGWLSTPGTHPRSGLESPMRISGLGDEKDHSLLSSPLCARSQSEFSFNSMRLAVTCKVNFSTSHGWPSGDSNCGAGKAPQ